MRMHRKQCMEAGKSPGSSSLLSAGNMLGTTMSMSPFVEFKNRDKNLQLSILI
jgi:hypothetical protein